MERCGAGRPGREGLGGAGLRAPLTSPSRRPPFSTRSGSPRGSALVPRRASPSLRPQPPVSPAAGRGGSGEGPRGGNAGPGRGCCSPGWGACPGIAEPLPALRCAAPGGSSCSIPGMGMLLPGGGSGSAARAGVTAGVLSRSCPSAGTAAGPRGGRRGRAGLRAVMEGQCQPPLPVSAPCSVWTGDGHGAGSAMWPREPRVTPVSQVVPGHGAGLAVASVASLDVPSSAQGTGCPSGLWGIST